jgi:hypothetical protein
MKEMRLDSSRTQCADLLIKNMIRRIMMKAKTGIIYLMSMLALLACGSIVFADGVAQEAVECTGWHALCSLATDCKVKNGTAYCNCWKVDEPYIVVTADIQDEDVKDKTRTQCTLNSPALWMRRLFVLQSKNGTFTVDNKRYKWVSTFSYRGWCEHWNPKACDKAPWADCMTYPCTENTDPKADPNRPLVCQCKVNTNQPFVGTNGKCKTKKTEVMSTINQALWDFDNNRFAVPMPGDLFVNKGACAPLQSDQQN